MSYRRLTFKVEVHAEANDDAMLAPGVAAALEWLSREPWFRVGSEPAGAKKMGKWKGYQVTAPNGMVLHVKFRNQYNYEAYRTGVDLAAPGGDRTVEINAQTGKARTITCSCATCMPIYIHNAATVRMILCPKCGNKRCPHATDHRLACTNSNEPGQPGSSYA